MNLVRALIIDDETAAQKTLSGMLKEFCPQVNVVGIANNIITAAQLIERLKPDLIFLDIQMSPYESGFDLIGRTRHFSYGVIFVTAYSQYAIKAINAVQPWAYLVKPFSSDDLMEAVRSANKKLIEKQGSVPAGEENLNSLIISDARKGKIIIRAKDVLYCKSDQAVVEIHFLKENAQPDCVYTYRTLRQILEELPDQQFFRIHHGFIVNLTFVSKFERNGRGGIIYLKNGLQLPVSVKRMGEFERNLAGFLG